MKIQITVNNGGLKRTEVIEVDDELDDDEIGDEVKDYVWSDMIDLEWKRI